jgi:hypothetical protein
MAGSSDNMCCSSLRRCLPLHVGQVKDISFTINHGLIELIGWNIATDIGFNTTRMKTECSETFVFASFVHLTCEQNTGYLGLTIHSPFVKAFASMEERIVKADGREDMTGT